jgi:hypothetical protein
MLLSARLENMYSYAGHRQDFTDVGNEGSSLDVTILNDHITAFGIVITENMLFAIQFLADLTGKVGVTVFSRVCSTLS